MKLGDILESKSRDFDSACRYYLEAVNLVKENSKATIALSKAHAKKGDFASAHTYLNGLLESPEKNVVEESTMILADIMCQQNSFLAASFHFRNIVESNPANYEALSRLLDVLKRLDKLDAAQEIFNLIEKKRPRCKIENGFIFCRGLYFRFCNKVHESMKQFVVCRKDSIWGERASQYLIELFLNPEDQIVGGEALDSTVDSSKAAADWNADSDLVGLMTAEQLIKELDQNPKSLSTQMLECHALMATKQKSEVEKAIAVQMNMLTIDHDYIPAIYGSSVGYMLLKQPPRARNQLKRAAKIAWSQEFGDDLEKCWLLLADIYIQGGKYDLATELLKKVILVNRSHPKAYEYLGFIMEKEASYADAATHYEQCWKLMRHGNPSIGFKLAFNLLKAKRFVDAIDVCHKVLASNPEYPKIKIEILDKARSQIRC